MKTSDACARDEAQRIRTEEGVALESIRYFGKVGEVRLLVITSRVQSRVTEYVPKTRMGPSLMVIKASPEEWQSRQLDLVPGDWRQEPVIVL